jgi:hypothetical protein
MNTGNTIRHSEVDRPTVRGQQTEGRPKHWGPSWLYRDEKTLAPASTSAPTDLTPADDADDQANEWHWSHVSDDAYRYLTADRSFAAPCPWCGGRLKHNPLCDELRVSWAPTLPWGRHKGKPLSEVPRDYLCWIGRNRSLPADLRTAIESQLQ